MVLLSPKSVTREQHVETPLIGSSVIVGGLLVFFCCHDPASHLSSPAVVTFESLSGVFCSLFVKPDYLF